MISSFSSLDGFVSNTLTNFVPKIMTRETLTIKEVLVIIESIDLLILVEVPPTGMLIVVSIDINSSKLGMICLRFIVASVHP